MKIYLNTIKDKECYEYEDVRELNNILNYFQIKKINALNSSFTITKMENIYELHIEAKVNLDVVSSYSLKVFPYNLNIDENLYLTLEETYENDDVILLENDYIEIDEILYSLVVTALPVNVHMENESLPQVEGTDVIKEEDVTYASPFDKLKDLDLDD